MRYICVQPSTLYYSWQIDVMILSFLQQGVSPNKIDIVLADIEKDVNYYLLLKKKYSDVNFYFYLDTRKNKNYISSIRPHILKKHFKKFSDLYKGAFLYHDCDIVLTRPLKLNKYLDDDICYLSDTISYIGYEYILSKGRNVLELMCSVGNISEETLKENQKNSGGCHYLLKNIDYKFWEKVEIDCSNLFVQISNLNEKIRLEYIERGENYHELQIWCSDMWAVLWNLWKLGRKTKVIDELDFIWAVENSNIWGKKAIYHNAGIIKAEDGKFYKGDYHSRIPPKNLVLDKQFSCYKYYELIKLIL